METIHFSSYLFRRCDFTCRLTDTGLLVNFVYFKVSFRSFRQFHVTKRFEPWAFLIATYVFHIVFMSWIDTKWFSSLLLSNTIFSCRRNARASCLFLVHFWLKIKLPQIQLQNPEFSRVDAKLSLCFLPLGGGSAGIRTPELRLRRPVS